MRRREDSTPVAGRRQPKCGGRRSRSTRSVPGDAPPRRLLQSQHEVTAHPAGDRRQRLITQRSGRVVADVAACCDGRHGPSCPSGRAMRADTHASHTQGHTAGATGLDGTKLAANASREQTVDYERIAREIIEEAKAVDAAEDELYGEARGDELPPELATGPGREKWLAEAKRRLDERRAKRERPIPGPRPQRLKEAKRRLRRNCGPSAGPTRPMRPIELEAWGATAGGWDRSTSPSPTRRRRRRRARLTPPTWTRGWSRTPAAGFRATTPRRSPTNSRS